MEKGWTEFQRHCLDYIAESLSSIKGLVNALGSDALEMYCQKGCLGKTCIDRVKSAKFAEPDGDEDRIGNEDQDDDEEEEEEEDGDGDDDTDTDTDGDEDENAAPEDEDEDKDEDGDGDDST